MQHVLLNKNVQVAIAGARRELDERRILAREDDEEDWRRGVSGVPTHC